MSETATKTILIVDDDEDYRLQQQMEFKAAGYNVIAAAGRDEAEKLLARTRPDAAVLDLMMDRIDDGFVLCHHIKKLDATIPVVLVTGVTHETGMVFDATTAEERSWVKADRVLAKPVRFEQLRREVERLLES